MPTHVHLPPVMRCISASFCPHPWNQWKLYYPNLLPQFRWGGERYEKALLNSSNKRSNSCWNCDVPLLTSDEEYICRPLCPSTACFVRLQRRNDGFFKRKFRIPFKIEGAYVFIYLFHVLLPFVANAVTLGNIKPGVDSFCVLKRAGRIPRLCVKLCAGEYTDGFRNLSSYVSVSTRTNSEILRQVTCWKVHGRIPKFCVKLRAGKHTEEIRKFASSYVLESTRTNSEILRQVTCW